MDDQELQHLLNENLRLAKENNRMLTKMYKFQRWQKASKVLYWIVLAAIALGAYYYAKPYIDNIFTAYSSIRETFTELQDTFGGKTNSQ